ncbi:SAUR-like auxin-responsive protein family [Striga hermonthica]|uniref:SAUR-like auxin-responsive protein family n=1 Tax=Striga hermonthica TaxID=68872 RepID=A0A9N7MZW5_STRHE|nr:SAUR-like auxin-responsive protein family [Striga hermonthica]
MASAIRKVNMIAQIVRLRQVVRRWKNKSLTRRRPDSDDTSGTATRLTPSGTVAVYVGPDRDRFVIPTRFLNLPVFVALLRQAEEEFGFPAAGGLALPCDPDFFWEVVRLLGGDERRFSGMGLDEFLSVISERAASGGDFSSSCKDSSSCSHAFAPLLPKERV